MSHPFSTLSLFAKAGDGNRLPRSFLPSLIPSLPPSVLPRSFKELSLAVS